MTHDLVARTDAGRHPWDIDLPDDLMTELMFVDDKCERADVAVMYGHRDFRSNLDVRADRGTELYRSGVVECFVCSGAETVEGGNRLIGASPATYLAKRLVAGGVPKRNVYVYRVATPFPLEGLQEFIRRGRIEPVTTTIVVTSPCRSRRDQLVAMSEASESQRVFICPSIEQCNASTWANHERWRRFICLGYHNLLCRDWDGARSCHWPEAIIENYQRRQKLAGGEQ